MPFSINFKEEAASAGKTPIRFVKVINATRRNYVINGTLMYIRILHDIEVEMVDLRHGVILLSSRSRWFGVLSCKRRMTTY